MEENQKEKNTLEVIQEMEEQQRIQNQKLLEQERLREEQERFQHEAQLKEDKKELLKLKQGVIDSSDTIYEQHEEEKNYTFGEKVSNFIYHNKWWMGFAVFFLVMFGYLTWQVVTTVKPDMIILLLVDDDFFNAACSSGIEEIFESYLDDVNGDGEVAVDVYYIPASQATAERDGYTGDQTKLFAEFQIGEAVLVISDDGADEFIVPDHNLEDLESYFGDYQETEGVRFRLKDTDFAARLEWDEPFDDDIYIGIRKVKQTMDSEQKMQEVYDVSFPALQKFVQEFGHLKQAE
ncbi:MAG: hypothetical protein IJ642_08030 [Oscillospiraceae bacterium]|nr:hypothetical protein [Oscillospiraceae bacterium]